VKNKKRRTRPLKLCPFFVKILTRATEKNIIYTDEFCLFGVKI